MGAFDLFDEWPVRPGAAGVLVRGSALDDSAAASVHLTETFGDLDAVSEWASVTKLLVALAVLIEADRGEVDLDDPAGPPGSTVRHLLSHASGLDPDSEEPLTAPGRRRIYSNAGFEVLARYLSERTGRRWQDVVAETVTGPMGMKGTSVPEGGSPASGAVGPVSDLLALGRELLSPMNISGSALEVATRVAFPGLAGVVPGIGRFDQCDWGLGFELKGSKRPHWTATAGSPRTFGHFGRSGAFLWVDPEAGVACATAGGAPFGPWALEKWPELSDEVLRTRADPGTWAGPGIRRGPGWQGS
jgi:CubicO group peptidase (beta-lactamase class C family)